MVWIGKVEAHAGLPLDLLVVMEFGAVVGGDGLEAAGVLADQPCGACGQLLLPRRWPCFGTQRTQQPRKKLVVNSARAAKFKRRVIAMFKTIATVVLLSIVPLAAHAHVAVGNAGTYALVKDVNLQSFLDTRHPWQLRVYQPVAKKPGDIALRPLRVCFVEDASSSKKDTTCHFLSDGNELTSVQLTRLPSLQAGSLRASIVMHVAWNGGLAATSGSAVYVWDFDKATNAFSEGLKSAVSFSGAQEFVRHGSLSGLFISADAVYEGDEPNVNTPTRYRISVYAPSARGYRQVLSFLTAKRYPDARSNHALADPIETLSPEITTALQRIYPHGMPELEHRW